MRQRGRNSLSVYPMNRNNHSDKCHFIFRQMSHSQGPHQQDGSQTPIFADDCWVAGANFKVLKSRGSDEYHLK